MYNPATDTWYDRSPMPTDRDHIAISVFQGKIYVAGQNGNVLVLREGTELEILARNDLGSGILATPALADGRIFVRMKDKVACYDLRAK